MRPQAKGGPSDRQNSRGLRSNKQAQEVVISGDELRARANRWHTAELERATRGMGRRWPEHREWVDDYVRTELRELLLAAIRGTV